MYPPLDTAQQLVQQGRLEDAEQLLSGALAERPDAATALLLAQLHWHQGRHGDALAVAEANVGASPNPQFMQALVEMRNALRGPQDALTSAKEGLVLFPDDVGLLTARLTLEMQLQAFAPAIRTADRLIAAAPGHLPARINRQALLLQAGRFQHALEDSLQAARELGEQLAFTQNRLAALLGLERYEEAAALAEAALAQFGPNIAFAHGRATALVAMGNAAAAFDAIATAEAAFGPALEWSALKAGAYLVGPGEADAVSELRQAAARFSCDHAGLLELTAPLAEKGDLRRVLTALAATEVDEISAGLAAALAQHRLAAWAYEDALAIIGLMRERGQAGSRLHLIEGVALAALRQFPAAVRQLERAGWELFAPFYEELRSAGMDTYGWGALPGAEEIAAAEYLAAFAGCDWTDYAARVEFLRAFAAQATSQGRLSPIPPFRSLMLPISDAERRDIAGSYARLAEARAAATGLTFAHEPKRSGERLRIGYVSADFRDHATSHLMRSLFGLHDRSRVEVYAYALVPGDGSEYQQKIAAECDRFTDISSQDTAAAARAIHNDGIDILIDLGGYTRHARPELFALRPAPLNVAWLGFAGTTGAAYMDCIVADAVVLPEANRRFFSEQPLLLPHCYQVNDQWQQVPQRTFTRSELGLPETEVVFAAVSRGEKIDPETFGAWMQILRAIPVSILWLLALPEHDAKSNLRRAAAEAGVAPERLRFGPPERKDRHLARLAIADLFLDSFIYNAHTAASDALWAGLPVVTCRGGGFAGRVGASLLGAVGLPELIADTPQEFVELAVGLARDANRRTALRGRLTACRSTPLYDTRLFAKELENALIEEWSRRFQ